MKLMLTSTHVVYFPDNAVAAVENGSWSANATAPRGRLIVKEVRSPLREEAEFQDCVPRVATGKTGEAQ